MENLLLKRQKQFRASGLVVFLIACGLLVARIVSNLLNLGKVDYTLNDTIFTFIVQIGFGLVVPFFVYKIALKKSTKQTLEFSNFRKPDWKIMLLCIPLTFAVMCATAIIATVWRIFLISFGYQLSSSGYGSGGEFLWYMLVLEIFLSAMLPAICEEFTDRGGLLTTLRGSYSTVQTALISGLIFGLSHQNIEQVFYTFCMGVFLAILVMKTKSIFPAMLVHFINNAFSIYQSYAVTYSLPFYQLINWAYDLIVTNLGLVMALAGLIVGGGVLLFWLIIKICQKNDQKAREKIMQERGESGGEVLLPFEDKTVYKPVFRDWIFMMSGMIIMAITTLSTFFWRI